MFLVLFMPYIGEYLVSLYTITEVVKRSSIRKKKKLEKLENLNDVSEKIKKLEKAIKDNEEFLKKYEPRKNNKIIITKNDNVKWLFLVMAVTFCGAFITPIGLTPFIYYLKSSVRKYIGIYC